MNKNFYDYSILTDNKLAVGWIDNRHRIDDLLMKGIAQNLTEIWTEEIVRVYKCPVYIDKDIDKLLNIAADNDQKFLLLLAMGNHLEGRKGEFIFQIIDYLKDNNLDDITVIGHLLDRNDKWFELHNQSILINIEWWKNAGKPYYGNPISENVSMPILSRSDENWHDEYTPHWIQSTNDHKIYNGLCNGHNILEKALQTKNKIYSWGDKFRQSKNYYYPTSDIKINTVLENIATTDTNKFFVANTETWPNKLTHCYDFLATPAAGLSPLIYAFLCKLKEHNTICIYDISYPAIEYQKKINSTTLDLTDIYNSAQFANKKTPVACPAANTEYNWQKMQNQINFLLKDGLTEFYYSIWPTLNIKYLHIDLLNIDDTARFVRQIQLDLKYGFLHLSNIFRYKNNGILNSKRVLHSYEMHLYKKLASFFPNKIYTKNEEKNEELIDDIIINSKNIDVYSNMKMLPWVNND